MGGSAATPCLLEECTLSRAAGAAREPALHGEYLKDGRRGAGARRRDRRTYDRRWAAAELFEAVEALDPEHPFVERLDELRDAAVGLGVVVLGLGAIPRWSTSAWWWPARKHGPAS